MASKYPHIDDYHAPVPAGFTGTKETRIGSSGSTYFWGYHKGELLRAKNGVGRNFKNIESAQGAVDKRANE